MPKHTCRKCGNSFDTDGKGKVISTPDKINKEGKDMGIGSSIKKFLVNRSSSYRNRVNKTLPVAVGEPKGSEIETQGAIPKGKPKTGGEIVPYEKQTDIRPYEEVIEEEIANNTLRGRKTVTDWRKEWEKGKVPEITDNSLEIASRLLKREDRIRKEEEAIKASREMLEREEQRIRDLEEDKVVVNRQREKALEKSGAFQSNVVDREGEKGFAPFMERIDNEAKEKRQSFSKGEKNFGAFWERAEVDKDQEEIKRKSDSKKVQCPNWRCKDENGQPTMYDIKEPFCPKCNMHNPRHVPKQGETACPYCNKVISTKDKICPNCKEKNPGYILKPGEVKCIDCGKVYPAGWKKCQNPDPNNPDEPWDPYNEPGCGKPNEGYVGDTKLSKSAKTRINTRIYEMLIYELVGVFLIFGLPFFGLPQMIWLGIVLMVLFPFYSFLPNEHEVLASVKRGEEEGGLSHWGAGSLILKGMVKLMMFIFTVMQFIILPVSKLIPLAISFVYYFSLPTSYKITQPFKMLEAWLRVVVGFFIGGFILMAFNFTPQAISLCIMSIAFFCTSFPTHKSAAEEEGVVKVQFFNKYGDVSGTNAFSAVEKILFFMLMVWALITSQVGWGTSSFQIIFYAVWILSLLSGLMAREGRPAMGILMILMTLFVFTFTATGVMGEAVFGYWWPQIYSFGESIAAPLAPMWEQAQSGMGDMWLMFTNPMGYYDVIAKRQQSATSVVKQGGTTKSIELTGTTLFTSVTGELEPILDPLIGSFEIQNQGEFEANQIGLKLWATWVDPKTVSATNPTAPIPTGTLKIFNCSQPSDTSSGKTTETIILPSLDPLSPPTIVTLNEGVCNWFDTTYPQEMKIVNFVFNKNTWDLGGGDDLAICIEKSPDGTGNPICEDKDLTGCCDSTKHPNTTYKHSGQTIKVNVNLTYDYNVNVSIPIEVINQSKYRDFLLARQITLQEITSQYTGGPVKATLWSQKQPVRDSGELSLFVASIVNEGGGTLNNITYFRIKIPTDIADKVDLIAQTFQSIDKETPPNGCKDPPVIEGKYWVIDCVHNSPMKTGEYKRVSFFVTPKGVTDRKTSLITGLANYNYTKTGSASIKIANAPWH